MAVMCFPVQTNSSSQVVGQNAFVEQDCRTHQSNDEYLEAMHQYA